MDAEQTQADPSRLFEPREFAGSAGGVLKYRLLKPADFDPTVVYPLVLFLHGSGERGADNTSQLKHGMAEFCRSERRTDFPCYVLAPQCPEEGRWVDIDWRQKSAELPQASQEMQLVFQLLDTMLADSAIDRRRIYITGLSMGGFGTWDAIFRRPNFFAAAAPICGGHIPAVAPTITKVPIWCFHGDADESVDVEQSRQMIVALREAGGEPRYTEYTGGEHDVWTPTYANDDLYAWLFSHRLPVPSE